MTFVVPFDGSDLAAAALVRAAAYARAVDEDVTAISVVPDDASYARRKGWIDADESFARETVVGRLHRQVDRLVPSASFQTRRVGRYPAPGTIGREIRRAARELDASVVFVGSANAGRIVVSVSSVGGTIAADPDYDVHIVRRRAPPEARSGRPKPDYYDRS